MSGKVLFDPTSDKWVLSDGEHYLEVPHWAREIIADEFERETRQLKTENDKLRDDRDGWKKVCVDQEVMHVMHEEMLDNDNAKLRELCADMWHVMWACAEQRCKHRENECYVVNGNNGALPSHDECWYKRRMRELGVDE